MSYNQGGRPPKSIIEKRINLVSVRFNAVEFESIKARSSSAGMTISNFVRATALNTTINERLSPEMRRKVGVLASMANNTNQIARKLNSLAPVDAAEFQALSRDISLIIDEIVK